ncbi:MAG: CaiB/BaiF CoA-transferase family protein [Pseudomonadota bacterium]
MGPLQGLKLIEMAAIGPVPFCATLLADMGADIIRIDRLQAADLGIPKADDPRFDVLARGRRVVPVDLKTDAGRALVLRLCEGADGLLEGFRPGVMERLGLGPEACHVRNPALVYARMTGFGQDGPLAASAGHDINYIALAGVLSAIGPADGPPVPPLNLIGDYGGGAMVLAFGLMCALHEAKASGQGQVVDAAMVEGAAFLMSMFQGLRAQGLWQEERAANLLDGGAPWYACYETADGKHVAIGAIEGRFYAALLARLGLESEALPDQHDRSGWPRLRARFEEIFKSKTQAAWDDVFAGSDACYAPVLSMDEAARHPHNVARGVFHERGGLNLPTPVPRFSRTPATVSAPPAPAGEAAHDALSAWGIAADEIDTLARDGVIGVRR